VMPNVIIEIIVGVTCYNP